MIGSRALLLLGLASAGCATTSGHDWLDSPLDQRTELSAEVAPVVADAPEAPPRLSHTVTLGESYAGYPAPAGAPADPAVQVNVHVPVVVNNWGGYGYGYVTSGYGARAYSAYGYAPSRVAPPRVTTPKVGADFPAPPDYGPRALR